MEKENQKKDDREEKREIEKNKQNEEKNRADESRENEVKDLGFEEITEPQQNELLSMNNSYKMNLNTVKTPETTEREQLKKMTPEKHVNQNKAINKTEVKSPIKETREKSELEDTREMEKILPQKEATKSPKRDPVAARNEFELKKQMENFAMMQQPMYKKKAHKIAERPTSPEPISEDSFASDTETEESDEDAPLNKFEQKRKIMKQLKELGKARKMLEGLNKMSKKGKKQRLSREYKKAVERSRSKKKKQAQAPRSQPTEAKGNRPRDKPIDQKLDQYYTNMYGKNDFSPQKMSNGKKKQNPKRAQIKRKALK